MKKSLIILSFLFSTLFSFAQEQIGIVKTIGRPGIPGVPIESVLVRAKGSNTASASNQLGTFSLVMPNLSLGDGYKLAKVYKDGYILADSEIIGREFPFSPNIPLEISMISKNDYNQTVNEIEKDIRNRVEREYQSKLTELNNKIESKSISEEHYRELYQELQDYLDNAEVLISKLADRYARTDYDKLDSLGKIINTMIEEGHLDEAERLILSKGTIEQRKENIKKQEEITKQLEETRDKSIKREQQLKDDFAKDLYTRFDIALMRFENKEAAKYLKERMLVDTLRFEWSLDYADFIRDFLGNYDEAMNIYQLLLSKGNNKYTCSLLYRIGNTYYLQGKYEQALDYYTKSTEFADKDSISTSYVPDTYHSIANIYIEQERFEEGLLFLTKSEEIYKKSNDTIGLSFIYNTKGVLHSKFGDFNLAVEYITKSLDIRRKYYGEINTNTASSYSNLATLFKDLDKYKEAYEYYQKSMEIDSTILGNNHPKIANHKLDIGKLLIKWNRHDNVLTLFTEALDIFKSFYGENHPDLIIAYNQLGSYYCNVEVDYNKALDYYYKSKELAKRIYGHNHSHKANALTNIANVYTQMSNLTSAIEFYFKAVEIYEKIYGNNHFLFLLTLKLSLL